MPGTTCVRRFGPALVTCVALAAALAGRSAQAHGSVVAGDDLCRIKIGYFEAHFKIYLPQRRGHEQYCEDLPATGEAVFVMEYLHAGLNDVPIEFRVIENVTGLGRFARQEHVAAINEIDAVTVLHEPPAVSPGVYAALHEFTAPGEYIGIVTARIAASGRPYTAVFPFEVGFTGLGYWPWFVVLIVGLQINYWFMSGALRRWRERLRRRRLHVVTES